MTEVWIMEYTYDDRRDEIAAFATQEAAVAYAEKSYGRKLSFNGRTGSWNFHGGVHQIAVFRLGVAQ